MVGLTTHVLDTARGKPAAGVRIMLYRVTGNSHKKIGEAVTNADGRTDAPMLAGKAFTVGVYELVFCAGEYLRGTGQVEGRGFVSGRDSHSVWRERMRGRIIMCRC